MIDQHSKCHGDFFGERCFFVCVCLCVNKCARSDMRTFSEKCRYPLQLCRALFELSRMFILILFCFFLSIMHLFRVASVVPANLFFVYLLPIDVNNYVSPAYRFFLCERFQVGCQNLNSVALDNSHSTSRDTALPRDPASRARISVWVWQPGGTGQPIERNELYSCTIAFPYTSFCLCIVYTGAFENKCSIVFFRALFTPLQVSREEALCRLLSLGTVKRPRPPKLVNFASASWATGQKKKRSRQGEHLFIAYLKCCPVPPRKFLRSEASVVPQPPYLLPPPNGVHSVKCARRL